MAIESRWQSYKVPQHFIDGFWAEPMKRIEHLNRIGFGPDRDHRGRRASFATMMVEKNHRVMMADRIFFEAMREQTLAMREAAAQAAERSGAQDIAALIRGEPVPEWSGP